MPSMSNPQSAAINISATGQTTIINNASSRFMYVWDLYMTCATATNVVFYNGAGQLTGNMNFAAGAIFDEAGLSSLPMWTIDPASNLSMTSTATSQRSGWVVYSN
jgi:hypothetical protein